MVKLEGNPEHPHSQGKLCARGQSGLMNTYDPDRVLTPLIRVGKRGEGKFRQASWDEALDLVAENMLKIKKNYGPEAMVFSSTHNLSQAQFENLLYGFGSPNYGTQRSLCFNAMIVANLMTYGMEEPARDYSQVEYILTGRAQPDRSHLDLGNYRTGRCHGTWGKGGLSRPALHQDRFQSHRMVPDPPRHRPGLPPGDDQRHHHREAGTTSEFVEQYTVGFDQLADAAWQNTRPNGLSRSPGIAGRYHPAHRP